MEPEPIEQEDQKENNPKKPIFTGPVLKISLFVLFILFVGVVGYLIKQRITSPDNIATNTIQETEKASGSDSDKGPSIDWDAPYDEISINEKDIFKYQFLNISDELLVRDPHPLEIDENYFLMRSVMSPDKKYIVYAVIEEEVFYTKGDETAYYKVFVKNVINNKVNETISINVEGGQIVLLPMFWTPSGKNLIYMWVNPTDIGRGGAPTNKYFVGDPFTGEVDALGSHDALILDDLFMISTDNNSNFEMRCGGEMSSEPLISNQGKIIKINLDTRQVTTLVEGKYKAFTLIGLSDNKRYLNYIEKEYDQPVNKAVFSDPNERYTCVEINIDGINGTERNIKL